MVSIRTRIIIVFLLIISIGLYTLVDWIVDDLRPRYLETMEESMVDMSVILASIVEARIEDGSIDAKGMRLAFSKAGKKDINARIYQVIKQQLKTRVYITDPRGLVVFDSDSGRDEGKDYSKWNDVYLTLKGEYGARATRKVPDDPTTTVLYVASPVMAGERIAGSLTVCRPTASVTLFVQNAKRKIINGSVLAGLAAALLGIILSGWLTGPIKKLTRYARAIRDGEKPEPPSLGKNEIGELGTAFEEMRDALEGRQYVENYIQTLTHEMKSPLSAIKGAAELLGEEMTAEQRIKFLSNIRTETSRMQMLIERLLRLSSLEARKELQDIEEISLSELIADVAESLKPMTEKKNISLNIECADDVRITGERFLLRQAFSNLLQNAINYSPEKHGVTVKAEQKDRTISLSVRDSGSGIPEYAIDRIFDRFYSLNNPQTGHKGTGLGLTFVKEVILLHGGTIRVSNLPGGGVEAALEMPVSRE